MDDPWGQTVSGPRLSSAVRRIEFTLSCEAILDVTLTTERFDPPLLDTAVSSALLRRVAAGELPSTFRLWTPDRIVAFGRSDRSRPGYPEAVRLAREAGFAPVERLAGGKAAVFHEGTLAFAWAVPEPRPRETFEARFEAVAELIAKALGTLGVDARVGEVPGEYCPGRFSVNARGTVKIMGVGQRLVRDAAHIGGVVVVEDAPLVNRPLIPVYDALDYEWDPAVTGAVIDEGGPGLVAVRDAIVNELGTDHRVDRGTVDRATVDLARTLVTDHAPPDSIP